VLIGAILDTAGLADRLLEALKPDVAKGKVLDKSGKGGARNDVE
jgi:hypothetical protein